MSESDVQVLNALMGVSTVIFIVSLIMCVLMVICMWKIFEKADEPGWAALVPFYNAYVLFKITWGNGWFFLLCLIPFVGAVILIITYWKLANVFGGGVVEFLLIWLLPVIAFPLIAFGSAEYEGIE